MLQNYQPRRNNKSFAGGDVSGGLRKPNGGGDSRELSTVRLSSGISANILDFRLPQKHVLGTMPAAASGWW
jgi:hypothetical protein